MAFVMVVDTRSSGELEPTPHCPLGTFLLNSGLRAIWTSAMGTFYKRSLTPLSEPDVEQMLQHTPGAGTQQELPAGLAKGLGF